VPTRLLEHLGRRIPTATCRELGALEILRPEVAGWIGTAIRWRDAAVHDGSLISFVQMQASVTRTLKTAEESEVTGPLMPDHTPVAEYARRLLSNVTRLVERSVRVLPEVDDSLLARPR
jgi:hypothetical protein